MFHRHARFGHEVGSEVGKIHLLRERVHARLDSSITARNPLFESLLKECGLT